MRQKTLEERKPLEPMVELDIHIVEDFEARSVFYPVLKPIQSGSKTLM
jgi:hypothetical protein